jgi:hypothetical protein
MDPLVDLEYPPVGTVATIQFTFRDELGALADPTAVTVRVRMPDGSLSVISGGSVTRLSLGVFKVSVVLSVAGLWLFTGVGTGAAAAASPDIPITVQSTRTAA